MIYLTSDTHFNHRNICGPDGFVSTRRHFTSVDEMNETIIANWNARVTQHDTVIHAGDLGINIKPKDLFVLLKRLNGNITIVPGNHDSVSKLIKYLRNNNYSYNSKPKFNFVEVGFRIKYSQRVYYVTHYPMGLGDQRPQLRNFCGHIHDTVAHGSNVLNIGVDSPEIPDVPFGSPIPFEEAVALVEAKWENWRKNNQTERLK